MKTNGICTNKNMSSKRRCTEFGGGGQKDHPIPFNKNERKRKDRQILRDEKSIVKHEGFDDIN